MPSPLRGIALMVLAMACFAMMNAAIRELAGGMPTTQVVFLRNITSFMMIALWIASRRQFSALRTDRITSHLWRAAIGTVAMQIWFYSLSILPLTLATALSFTTPVFGTVFAIWILKEKASWRRWSAIAVSFVGVIIILRPDAESLNAAALIVLVSSALMALAGIVVKSLTRTQAPETIVFYMALLMTPLSAPLGILHWGPVSFSQAVLILFVAVTSTTAHLLVTRAYVHADMVTLLPFDFMRLLFTAGLAYVFFHEVMDGYTLLGAGIILAAAVYIAHRESVRRGEARKPMDVDVP